LLSSPPRQFLKGQTSNRNSAVWEKLAAFYPEGRPGWPHLDETKEKFVTLFFKKNVPGKI